MKLKEIPKLFFSKQKWALFLTAMIQVTFVSMNVTFIAHSKIIPMLITGFMISFVWTINVKKVALGNWLDRITYANGAMFGTGLGFFISKYLSQLL